MLHVIKFNLIRIVVPAPDADMALAFLSPVPADIATANKAADQERRIVFSYSVLFLDPGN